MRTLGNGIDSSLLDLKGGTTGQILSKASAANLDYSWIDNGWSQIATAPLSGTTVSFTAISQIWKDLRLVLVSAATSGAGTLTLRLGTASIDTGTNYLANYSSLGTAAWTAGTASTSLTASGISTATFGMCVYDFPEYSRATSGKLMIGSAANSSSTTRSFILGTWNGSNIAYLNIISSTSFTGGTAYLLGRE